MAKLGVKNICMIATLALLVGCGPSKMYPRGFFAELAAGKHWDCDRVRHMEIDFKTKAEVLDAISYCSHDPSLQYNPCGPYPQLRVDWKTGKCEIR